MSLKFFVKNSDATPPPTNLGLTWERRFKTSYDMWDAIQVDKNVSIAVGDEGVYRSDTDGQFWDYIFTPTVPTGFGGPKLTSIAYNGVYVAVGYGSTNFGAIGVILTSTDSLSWTYVPNLTTTPLSSIIWNGSIFVATGSSGTILTSPDGINWTTRVSFTSNAIQDISWSGSLFVAITFSAGVIGTSPDGITWTARSTGGSFSQFAITSGNGLFVITGGNGGGQAGAVSTSSDGITWTHTALSITQYRDVIWTGTLFIIIGSLVPNSPPRSSSIRTSSDGINWSIVTPTELVVENYTKLLWTGSKYFLFSSSTSFVRASIQTSSNLITWNTVSRNRTTLNAIAWSGTRFAAVGENNGTVITSDDLKTWTVRQNSTNASTILYDVTWAGNQFIAVGDETREGSPTEVPPYITSSSDGLNWTRVGPVFGTSRLRGVAGSGSMYVAVGLSGVILSSPDGITWTRRDPPGGLISPSFSKVIWAGNQFVAVGHASNTFSGSPYVITSPDGITWTYRSIGTSSQVRLYSIAWSGNTFVVVGENVNFNQGFISTSTDAINWTVTSTSGGRIDRVIWVGNRFVIGGRTSTDGTTWTATTGGYNSLGLVATTTRVVSVNALGDILVSPPLGYTTH